MKKSLCVLWAGKYGSLRDSIMCLMFCDDKQTSTEQLQWCDICLGEMFSN